MIDKHVGNYRILELIGKGGMAVVYKGQHLTLSRRVVAIKMLSTELERDPSFSERFFREAEVMDRLRHPNIVTLYDFIEQDNHHFIVMEYVSGIALDRIIKEAKGPLPLERVKDIFKQVLDAIGYAHRLGIVHRDLKPSNIMITDDGAVKITDFGIARLLAGEFEATLTATGLGIGSPYYMSPEQVLASKDHPITAASDIYSLGITLYQMVTGRVPFSQKDSLFTILQAHLSATPPPPTKYCPDIPAPLEEVILRAIEKKPEKRWGSCEEFWTGLKSALGDSIAAGVEPSVTKDAEEGKTERIAVSPPLPTPDETIAPVEPSKGKGWPKILLTFLIVAAFAGAGMYFYKEYHKKALMETRQVISGEKRQAGKREAANTLKKAEKMLESGNYGAALKLAEEALKKNPDNSDALAIKKKAEEALKAKAAQEKRQKEIQLKLAEAAKLLKSGRYEEAKNTAQEVLSLDATNEGAKKLIEEAEKKEKSEFVTKKLKEGYAYLNQQQYKLALEVADSILEKYPEEPKALKLQADILSAKEKIESGRENEIRLKLVKAEAYLDSANYKKARLLAQEILKLDDNNEQAKKILAAAKEGERKKFVDEKISKGYTYLEARAYKLAIKEASDILNAYPNEPRALELKSEAEKRLKEARQRELAKRQARIAQYMREGKRFYKLGKYEQSILAFREVLRIDPKNKEAAGWLKKAKSELEAIKKAWATGGGEYNIEKKNAEEEK